MIGSANTTRIGRTSRSTTRAPVTPAERFQPAGDEQRELLGLWLPGSLAAVPEPQATPTAERAVDAGAAAPGVEGGPVEFDRVVPPSGNLWAMGRQFWLGPQRAGRTVRFWAGVDVIHLSIAGARVKSLRSHLSVADLDAARSGGRGRGRSAAAAAGRGRGGDRGRPRGQQQRPGLASPAARCSRPRSSAGAR